MKAITTVLLMIASLVGFAQQREMKVNNLDHAIETLKISGFDAIYFEHSTDNSITAALVETEGNRSYSFSNTDGNITIKLKQQSVEDHPNDLVIKGDLNNITAVELKGSKPTVVYFPNNWDEGDLQKWTNKNKVTFIRDYKGKVEEEHFD